MAGFLVNQKSILMDREAKLSRREYYGCDGEVQVGRNQTGLHTTWIGEWRDCPGGEITINVACTICVRHP